MWRAVLALPARLRFFVARRMLRFPGPTNAPSACPLLSADVARLVLPHLSSQERMALSCTCRDLAVSVWRDAPGVTLRVVAGTLPHPWHYPTAADALRLDQLPALLSRSLPRLRRLNNLHLSLGPVGSVAFGRRITGLELSGLVLPAAELATLRDLLASLLPHLRSLHLAEFCLLRPSGHNPAPVPAASPHLALALAPSGPLHLSSFSHSCHYEACSCGACALCIDNYPRLPTLEPAFSVLLDPSRLQCLTTDERSIFPMLGRLPALRSLHVVWSPRASSSMGLQDEHFKQLLEHTGLREVWLTKLSLSGDYFSSGCQLHELRFLNGTSAALLAALPGSIGRVVVQRTVWQGNPEHCRLTPDEVWARLRGASSRLVFQAAAAAPPKTDLEKVRNDRSGLRDDEPRFLFAEDPPRSLTLWAALPGCETPGTYTPHAAALLQLIIGRLQGPGALSIQSANLFTVPSLLALLQHLPPDIHTLCLPYCRGLSRDPRTMFAYLPPQITRLVVRESEASKADAATMPLQLRSSLIKGFAVYRRGDN